jgi:hypothetical protein
MSENLLLIVDSKNSDCASFGYVRGGRHPHKKVQGAFNTSVAHGESSTDPLGVRPDPVHVFTGESGYGCWYVHSGKFGYGGAALADGAVPTAAPATAPSQCGHAHPRGATHTSAHPHAQIGSPWSRRTLARANGPRLPRRDALHRITAAPAVAPPTAALKILLINRFFLSQGASPFQRETCDHPPQIADQFAYHDSHAIPSPSRSRPARYPGCPAYSGAARAAFAALQLG